ncbi:hypothetical protein ADL15_15660 [Actinoplanes awajinensis subsp. mycoplanecinus]|uniref:Ig-like domain repeat protein n=1 Tax=Actinoplanes awajinensis subsp. mycoplanecinus TaxID=135947 RepID=A0A0X3UPJ1_9ACTN|nr:hypothetical protein ADL15_15660 [Actinoplanes awajinensis subsp. mycoplanecinus]
MVAALAGSTVLAAGAAPALADSGKTLPITSVGDLVVDGAHQRIFVSDPTGGKIVETTYDGTVVATATGLPRVTGLALSAGGDTLYGTLEAGRAIVALPAATLTDPVRYDLGTGVYPLSLESVAGKLWFSYDDYGRDPYIGGDGNIGSLDLSGDAPVVALQQDSSGAYGLWSGAPHLTSAPGGAPKLAAFDPGTSSGVVAVYDVSSGTLNRTAAKGIPENAYTRDVAFTPDASRIVTAAPSPQDRLTVVNSADLEPVGSYPFEAWANAVAIAADGTVAANCSSGCGPDLRIFAPGGTRPIRTYVLPDTDPTVTGNDDVVDRGLAWEPDGNRLFAVTQNSSDAHHLRVFTEPKKSLPTLKLSGPASATRAKPVTITGTLTASLPLPVGAPVTVTRIDLEYPSGKSLGTRTTAANGSFSFTDTTSAGGTVTYRVSYPGDANHSAVTATRSVAVSRAATSLSLTNNGKIYGYGKTVTFTARLGASYKNRAVEIWADPSGADQKRRLLKRAVAGKTGYVSTSLRLTRNTTVSAVFAGDARTAPKTVTAAVGTKVNVSLKLSKYYKTSKGTRYYHVKTNAKFAITMTAAPTARKAYLSLQVLYRGKWQSLIGGYYPTPETFYLNGAGFKGYKLRIRTAYVKGDSGDSLNTTTWTGYQYLSFTK